MSNDTLRQSTRRRRPTPRHVIFERAPARRRRGDAPEVIVLVDEGSDEDENSAIPMQDLEEARPPVQTVQEALVTIHIIDGIFTIRIHSMAVQFGMFDEYILDI